MDLRITIDISERLAGALNALASTIQSVSIQTAPAPIQEPLVYSVEIPNAQPAQMAPEPAAETEPVVIPPEPESAPTGAVQPQETPVTETPANDDAPAVEPAPEKPKKKKFPSRASSLLNQ